MAVRQWVEKTSRRKPKKAAMVAAARKLAEGIWRLFALGEAFDLRRAFDARAFHPGHRTSGGRRDDDEFLADQAVAP